MLGVGDYLWRLLPANPILLRVVETAGKKKRDLFIRCGYLGLLVLLVVFKLLSSSDAVTGMSLSKLSNASREIFQGMSYLQLGLVALLGPIFTAGAITQEKDSQTYDILLATPLTNGQIVLGSLLSRLFFVIALLISGIPIFSVTQIFGGVAIDDIAMAFGIAAATAFVTGCLAMAIATFKVGTRRTIFSFYLFIVIYLVGLWLLDTLPFFHVAGPSTSGTQSHVSWFTGIHPFLALRSILGDPTYRAPDLSLLPPHLRAWPLGWYLTSPAAFYVNFMFMLSVVLVLPSIILLRKMAQATLGFNAWVLQKLHIKVAEKKRKPRTVWSNPIAWREAKTKASAARASVVRYGFILAGVGGAIVLVVLFAMPTTVPKQYIASGSYNSGANSLFIHGDSTYGLSRALDGSITLNGQNVGRDMLGGHFEVAGFITTTRAASGGGKVKEIASIQLRDIPRRLSENDARQFLLGACILEFAVILLIVTNAAASTVTREKEDGSLDLLLTTPITSRYYIWGKLRGLVSYVLPLVAVPVASVAVFILYDIARYVGGRDPNFKWIVFPEAVLILPATLVIVVAFASILGMQMSLRCRTTVRAVMSSVGIMIALCGMLGWCGYAVLETRMEGGFNLIFAAFSPFTVMTILIDPWTYGGSIFTRTPTPGDVATGRFLTLVFSWIATAAYAAAVWAMYKSMVKNFDMTIRRQSR